jgi:hypothetical protein
MPAVVLTADGTPGISVPDCVGAEGLRGQCAEKRVGCNGEERSVPGCQVHRHRLGAKSTVSIPPGPITRPPLQVGSASVSAGLSKALIGQQVDPRYSRAAAQRLGRSDGTGKAPADDAAVYVIDILGIAG